MRRLERRKLGWDWWLVLVVVLVAGCCLGSCLPVARRKVVLLRSGPGLDALGVQAAGFDSALERSQLTDVAREMMAKELTPVEAQVMMLHFGEDMPLATISRLLKMENASGAKAYVVSAKRKLKLAVDRWTARMQRSPQDGRSSHE